MRDLFLALGIVGFWFVLKFFVNFISERNDQFAAVLTSILVWPVGALVVLFVLAGYLVSVMIRLFILLGFGYFAVLLWKLIFHPHTIG